MKLILQQNNPKMRHRHIKLVDMVAVFLRSEGIIDMSNYELMVVELIFDVMRCSTELVGSYGLGIEVVGRVERIRGYGDRKLGLGVHHVLT